MEAIARFRGSTPRIEGPIVGSGPLEPQVRKRIQELKQEDRIKMCGFVNQSEMPQVLWTGDILAMCSEKDPHPLAVSEAMAVGNAIVASDRVGCVGPTGCGPLRGRNALTYACGATSTCWRARLRTLAADDEQRESMRNQSWELAHNFRMYGGGCAGAVIRFLQERRCRRNISSPAI